MATTTAPLRLGHYHTYPNALLGDLDEVVIWNVSRTTEEIDRVRRRRVMADETPPPLGLWHFDEQEGVSTLDASTQANVGILQGGAGWTTSPVPR